MNILFLMIKCKGIHFVCRFAEVVIVNLQSIILADNDWDCESCDILYLSQWIRENVRIVPALERTQQGKILNLSSKQQRQQNNTSRSSTSGIEKYIGSD